MGAELFIAVCPLPCDTHSDAVSEATPNIRRQVAERLARIPSLVQIVNDNINPEDASTHAEAVAVATDVVCDLIKAWSDSRQIDVRAIGSQHYILSGGPTWGDAPTDYYDVVNFVDTTKIFVDLFDPEDEGELVITLRHPDAAELIRQIEADPNPAEVIALGLANIAEWRSERDA